LPIQITATNPGFRSGQKVTIAGVLGNTAANGTWTITQIDPNTFTLNGSLGSGAYTSGGVAVNQDWGGAHVWVPRTTAITFRSGLCTVLPAWAP